MLAKFNTDEDRERAYEGLRQKIDKSRFTATIEHKRIGRKFVLSLYDIRLREKKDYCGNHPGPCLVGGRRRHQKTRWLEGSDWVSWNDMLNDVLDRLKLVADVASGHCVLRKGRLRRIHYGDKLFFESIVDWDRLGDDDDYADYVGQKAPPSTCPAGTPGLRGWRRKRRRVAVPA